MDMMCPPGGGSKQNFMSIDDILMSSEKVPSTFLVSVKGLGYLDQSTNNKDIEVGSKMDLPLWLVLSLAHPRKKFISSELTKPYKATYREILKADASVVNLYKLCPYYYALGQQLLTLNHAESGLVAKSLLFTFNDRFRKIMDLSWNAVDLDSASVIHHFDEIERKLFALGQKSLQSFHRWDVGESRTIQASKLVTRHRKRKRDVVD